ncbi:MAG: glycosyltransferase [Phormidium sp. GEM2.Bin31]|nr:MAG: glycosyltransferase [Phormidium sp. GEM2.Bin31]
MKIAYLNYFDLSNPECWTRQEYGFIYTNYNKAKSLENFAEVVYICALDYKLSPWRNRQVQVKRWWYKSVLKQSYVHWATPHLGHSLAAQIQNRLRDNPVDLIIGSDTTLVSHLHVDTPVVLWATNLFTPLLDRYPDYTNLCWETIQGFKHFDRQSLKTCERFIFPSNWAAQNAHEAYGVPIEQIDVVPYGANLAQEPTGEQVKSAIAQRPKDRLNLLFIGVDWQRKGGALAVAVAKQLNDKGIPTTLTVVGGQVPATFEALPFVRSVGFIDKFTKVGATTMSELFERSHALLLPSEAETYGNVLCEANAFGVPVLATAVDGIPTIIQGECNGKSFAREEFVEGASRYLQVLFQERDRYPDLAHKARREYEQHLNWGAVSQKMERILRRCL